MFTQAPCWLAILTILLSCSREQKTANETDLIPPDKSGGAFASTDTTLAGNYFSQAEKFSEEAEYDSAIVDYEKAAALYEAEGNWEKHVRCYSRIGAGFIEKVDHAQAVKYLSKAFEAGAKHLRESHPEMAGIYYHFGMAHYLQRAYDQAIQSFDQASTIQIAALGEQHPEVAKTYFRMGLTYADKGDNHQALIFHEKALAIQLATLGDQHMDVARSYSRIAVIYRRRGDYERARAFFDKAIAIGRVTLGEHHPQVAAFYHSFGNVFFDQGEYDQALRCWEKSLAIRLAKLGEQHLYVSYDYNNIGNAYQMKGDFSRALSYHQKALSIKRAIFGERHSDVAMAYNNIGRIHQKQGDNDQALRFFKKALAVHFAGPGTYHSEVAETYINMGDVYESRGDYGQALDYYQRAIAFDVFGFSPRDPLDNPDLNHILFEQSLLEALAKKARALANRFAKQSRHLRDLEAAFSTYQHASQLIDQMRSGYKAEGSKLFLAEKAADIYEHAIRAALLLHRETKEGACKHSAFMLAERSKAGVILESLSEAEAKQFAGIPDSLLDNERCLRIDLAFYERRLIEERLKKQNADSAKLASYQDKAFGLEQDYDALLRRFEKEYPDYYNLKYQVHTASVKEVQEQLLDDRTALVEYFTGKDSIFIFAITQENFEVKTVAKDIFFERQIEQLRRGIIRLDFTQYAQAAHRLYQTLLAPVAGGLGGKNLIIVPDAALCSIPYEALLTRAVGAEGGLKEYPKLPYLLNRHAISYAYSATLLQHQQLRKKLLGVRDYLAFAPVFADGLPSGTRGADFLGESFADDSARAVTRERGYLPATKKEVTGILNQFQKNYGFFERWFGNRTKVYLQHEAKEERLESADLASYRHLHFATHGLVNEKNPKLSGLILAQEDTASTEDGILFLGEIYNLKLNADLVVLSACETGLGQIAKGEGIIGLTRGFLYAGASNVLVSLWQVSDMTTSDLMVAFYGKMLSGMSKPTALAEAKREMLRRDPIYAKPYYWAPFILVGK